MNTTMIATTAGGAAPPAAPGSKAAARPQQVAVTGPSSQQAGFPQQPGPGQQQQHPHQPHPHPNPPQHHPPRPVVVVVPGPGLQPKPPKQPGAPKPPGQPKAPKQQPDGAAPKPKKAAARQLLTRADLRNGLKGRRLHLLWPEDQTWYGGRARAGGWGAGRAPRCCAPSDMRPLPLQYVHYAVAASHAACCSILPAPRPSQLAMPASPLFVLLLFQARAPVPPPPQHARLPSC